MQASALCLFLYSERVDERFQFGRNWKDFNRIASIENRESACNSLLKLLLKEEIAGKSVLDIGSGSGIHSFSFLRLGATHVTAIDYDVESVAATKETLLEFDSSTYRVQRADILDLSSMPAEKFDIVYSWGVLHHTGNLRRAITNASGFVKPGGLLVVALYRKTPYCWLWKIEKRFYSKASLRTQQRIMNVYRKIFSTALMLTKGQRLKQYELVYRSRRGMNLSHDFHDWLGGYPYESISARQYQATIGKDFLLIRKFTKNPIPDVLGSGCDEFVHRKSLTS